MSVNCQCLYISGRYTNDVLIILCNYTYYANASLDLTDLPFKSITTFSQVVQINDLNFELWLIRKMSYNILKVDILI